MIRQVAAACSGVRGEVDVPGASYFAYLLIDSNV